VSYASRQGPMQKLDQLNIGNRAAGEEIFVSPRPIVGCNDELIEMDGFIMKNLNETFHVRLVDGIEDII